MPTLAEFLCGGERRVPRSPLPTLDPLEAWGRAPESGLRATWLGHSTLLLEIEGTRVLTDPVWGTRASPSRLLGPRRFQSVPVRLRALPPLDLVIVSDDHYDYFDYPTIRELAGRDVPFVTSLGVRGSQVSALTGTNRQAGPPFPGKVQADARTLKPPMRSRSRGAA